jgi:DNA-binding response OmpR family regulator
MPETETETQKKRIMVVDDDANLRRLLSYNLSQSGFDVLMVNRGDTAMEKLKVFNPDLMILDIMMPGLDGLSCLKSLRDNPNTRGLPVILLTAVADLDTRLEACRTKVSKFITKPFNLPELLGEVNKLLQPVPRL